MDISNYDATLVKKLSLNDVRDIDFSLTGPGNAMTSPQTLYALSAAQIQVLSPKQLSDLSALYKSLSSVMPQGQISAISTAQIQTAATVDSFDDYLLNRMSKTQLSAFTAFSGGNDSALLAKLKPTTLSAFSPTALSTIDATEATALTIEQVKALQPAQLALLSDAVIAALGSSTSNHANVIKSLTTAQINALSDSALIAEIANLTNTQLKGLDASSLNANNGSNSFTSLLSASQAQQLTGSQIQQLTEIGRAHV